MYKIGVDIGGTQTRVGLVKDHKEIETLEIFSTDQNFEITINKIADIVNGWKDKGIGGIGISCPGPTNYTTGLIIKPLNLPHWHGKNIIKSLREKTNIANIKVDNDGNLGALGEYLKGQANGQEIIQFFTISTGIGAGLIINGKIFKGQNGHAQEVANILFNDLKTAYNDLPNGSIESYASGTGIYNFAKKLGLKVKDTKGVFKLYENNDIARRIINLAIEGIARLIVVSITMIDPTSITFSGSIALHNPWFIAAANARANKILNEISVNKTPIFISDLEGLGAIYGASHI